MFFAEVAKCQLLCFWCHVIKSRENGDGNKLTPPEVEMIKTEASAGIRKQREIGDRFGVSQTTVSAIKCGRTWKDLSGIDPLLEG